MPVKKGTVYLVGAGPGDLGLVTLKAIDLMARADVIVYDHLVDERLLEHAPLSAERIYAGKSGSKHTLEQAEINSLLVKKGRQGKTVVRLKGGDPFVLGRGGEEAEALYRACIPFQVVPGITSAVAVPAYAGIPVTHRGLSSSFAVVTGHEDPAKRSSSIRWNKLATAADTLIFLMGVGNLSGITRKLIDHGRSPGTPVAVIRDGTQPGQVTLTGTLADIAAKVRQARLGPPAVIVVGDVVRLRDKLRWFDNRPLSGKRVLVTRPAVQSTRLEKLLLERGALPVRLPVIEIQPESGNAKLDRAIKRIKSYEWLIFTSINGVKAFFSRLEQLGMDSRRLAGVKIAAIGPATSGELLQQGIKPDYIPGEFTSAGLLAGLGKKNIRAKRFLLARADIADKELSEGLIRLGAQVDDITVYHTANIRYSREHLRRLLSGGRIDIITFTSASTVKGLVQGLTKTHIALIKAKTACIGQKTAGAAIAAGLKADIIAGTATLEGMVTAMEKYFSEVR
jgi:uroporphyrinogen III methyltransferase/synthase